MILVYICVTCEDGEDLRKMCSPFVLRYFQRSLPNIKVHFCSGRNDCALHRNFMSNDQTAFA